MGDVQFLKLYGEQKHTGNLLAIAMTLRSHLGVGQSAKRDARRSSRDHLHWGALAPPEGGTGTGTTIVVPPAPGAPVAPVAPTGPG